jgi:general secretion pathway protein G
VRDVIDKFHGDTGRYPETLQELVEKRYLRALPVDPVTESATTWELVPVPDGYKGVVYDIHSGSPGTSRDGTKYGEW